jgi:hypothetical protein
MRKCALISCSVIAVMLVAPSAYGQSVPPTTQPVEQPTDHRKLFYGAIVRWSDQFSFSCCKESLEAAKNSALSLCNSDKCKLESTMNGSQCFVLFRLKRGASGPFGWAVGESIDAASKSALTACLMHGTSCTKTASLCADGSNFYHWRQRPAEKVIPISEPNPTPADTPSDERH